MLKRAKRLKGRLLKRSGNRLEFVHSSVGIGLCSDVVVGLELVRVAELALVFGALGTLGTLARTGWIVTTFVAV